ncbi:hypothetical protein [Streptomyces sp. NPDC007929]|uniref:hypothetical protein n=1 Tax=unclassified Streptomyces TaxID=2593676 RepID=UPI0036E14CC7
MEGETGLREGNNAADGTRVVLAAGVSLDPVRHEGPPPLDGGLDPLDEAPEHSAAVAEALEAFGYYPWPSGGAGEPPELPERLRAAVKSGADILVVHIAAHGLLARAGSGGLYVVGRDGEAVDEAVDQWISLIEDHPRADRPLTLFLLDLCYSGTSAVLPWHQRLETGERRAWVIAASGPDEPAFDFRLSRAIAMVLRRYQEATLRVDPSQRFIPLPAVAREISRVVAEMNLTDGMDQRVTTSRVPFADQLDHLPFFPNPLYGGSGPREQMTGLDEGTFPLLDEGLDVRHFLLRAAGSEALSQVPGRGYFHGREAELADLSTWCNGGGGPLRVVTGKPGVGKSALLGVLVCAAHPGLRARAPGLWWRLRHTPAANDRLAVVHARRRSLTEIAESLARQMGGDVSRSAKGWGVEQLLALAQDGAARPFTLVVDALDEAERPSDVVFALLMPLLNARTPDGRPVVRLLVGARREPGFAPLLEAARQAGGLIDLDVADSDGVRSSLRHYIADLLAVDTPYAVVDGAAVGAAFAESLADELMPARQPHEQQPLGWGEFLVAGMYVRHMLDSPVVTDTDDARRVAREVPRDLPGLLDLELRRPGSHPWLGPVLTALAWAQGMGMPERIVAHVAGAFATGVAPAPLEDVREALDAGRFFLRQAVETDGNTLYRLFHEGLAEHLRARPRQGGPQQAQAAATSIRPAGVVLRGLLDSVPASPDGGRVWEAADPYALRHAAGHALASDSVDSLLNDMEFLVHGDPASVDAVLSSARSDGALLVAAVYRASYEVHRPLTAYQRRQILAVDAARHAEPAMGERLARPSGWAPVWATGRGVALALLNTLHDASGRLTGVASASVNGRPAAVTASWDGTAKVWDLTTGLVVSTLAGHTDRLSATAVADVAGRPLAVTASWDGTAKVWDLTTGLVVSTLAGHTDRLSATAVADVAGRPLAVTASADGTVRVWDAMGGEQITVIAHHSTRVTDVALTELDSRAILVAADNHGTAWVWDAGTGDQLSALRGHNGALSSVAVDRLRGDPVILTTGWDRTARIWDLRSGSEVAVLRGHRNMVTGAALTDFDGRAVAVTSSWDTTARVWDVATGETIATLRGHRGALTGVTVQRVGRRLTAVTVGGHSDRTVRIWDLGTRSPVRAATGHTDTVTSVALAGEEQPPIVVTAGEDHTACVWDARTNRQVAQWKGHTAAVTAVALLRSGDRLLAVTGSADRTTRLWDTARGAAVAVLPGRGSAVTGVATGTLDGHPIIAVTTGGPRSVAVVWDVSDLEAAEKLCEYTGHHFAITAVVLTRIGSHAVAVTSDEAGTSHVWYVASGRLVQVLAGRRSAVAAAAGARLGDRDLVVTACGNHTAYVWDLSSGHCVRTLDGHTAPLTDVTTVTFDGLLLAITAAEDRTVRVHDLASGRPLTTISLPAVCASVTAASDGTVVLALGQDVLVINLENWRSV